MTWKFLANYIYTKAAIFKLSGNTTSTVKFK